MIHGTGCCGWLRAAPPRAVRAASPIAGELLNPQVSGSISVNVSQTTDEAGRPAGPSRRLLRETPECAEERLDVGLTWTNDPDIGGSG
ncbi:hypothetical protein [Mycobacterium asiaticum]|uniref:Uncharacterized protein n=1 Tax=Mycobacterium asiaticum TaxID=1790 RepID=A0A1A3N385_MYCAS|nr:hypothetical protein [Mycobacterium asiaticum]OBK16261.1 hypothetical protein A5635_06890 [Mycobacterium asiaticum]